MNIYKKIFALLILITSKVWPGTIYVPGNFNFISGISAIDTDTNLIIDSLPIGICYRCVLSPDGSTLYADSGFYDLVKIDLATFTVVDTITLPNIIGYIAISPDGSNIYTLRPSSGAIDVIDPVTYTVSTTITGFSGPRSMAVSPDSSKLYVANQTARNVLVVDTATNMVSATITGFGGGYTQGVSFTPDNKKAFVGTDANLITVVDVATDSILTSFAAPAEVQLPVSFDGTKLYSCDSTSKVIEIFNPKTYASITSITTTSTPFSLALSPDQSKLYAPPNSSPRNLNYYDPNTLAFEGFVSGNVQSQALIGTPNSYFTWLTDADSSWNTSTNWYPQIVPQNANFYFGGVTAQFLDNMSGPRAVSISSDATLKALYFDSAQPITIASGGGNLILTDTPTITVSSGTGAHEVSANISLLGDLTITKTTASNFTISGNISGSQGVTISTTGSVIFSGSNSYTGTTNISSGTLAVGSTGVLSSSSAVNVAGTLDISSASTDQSVAGLSGAGAVTLGTRALSVIGTGTGTLSGTVSGSGNITKSGTGTLGLSGDSSATYSGTTAITAGTLIAGNNGALGSGSVNMSDGSTLVISDTINLPNTINLLGTGCAVAVASGTSTLSGNLTNSGGLTKTGAGILNLTNGSNNYTGATTISEGTLALNTAGVLSDSTDLSITGTFNISSANGNRNVGSISGSGTINLGTRSLSIVGNNSTTFSGDIIGSGGFTQAGTGTTTLTGNNTFTGGIIVSSGTLKGNASAFQDDITNNATLTFDQSGTGTFSNVITGNGIFTKEGTGTLIFDSASTSTQTSATLSAGTVAFNQNFTFTSTISVGSAATLKGTGPIGSLACETTVLGTIAPGNSIGVTTVLGNYTQASGSTFEVELNPTSADLLLVSGSYTLEPNVTLALIPEAGTYTERTLYQIVSASSFLGVTSFDILTTTLPSLSFDVFAFSDGIYLLLNIIPFSQQPLGGNAGTVGGCLDSATIVQGSDLDSVIDQLHFMSTSQQESSLNSMQPSLFNAFDLVSQETFMNVQNILEEKRFKGCQASSGLWIDYYYNRSYQDRKGQNVGFTDTTQAGLLGYNWIYDTGHGMNFLSGYTNDSIEWKSGYGKGTIDTVSVACYPTLNYSNFYANFAFMTAYQRFEATRNILFPSTQYYGGSTRQAKHHNNGFSVLGGFELGSKLFNQENCALFVKGDYIYNFRSSFTETGANSINLKVHSHNADLLRAEAGVRFQMCLHEKENSSNIIFTKLSGIWEERFLGKKTNAEFVSTPCVMEVSGLHPQRALGSIDLGVNLSHKNISLTLEGNALIGKSFTSYLGRAELAFFF